jgi:hypothetical protein
VRLGDFNLANKTDDRNVQESSIRKIFKHPKYLEGIAYYDIAVIKITPVEFNRRIRPICLPDPSNFKLDQFDDVLTTIIGWESEAVHGKPSDTLKRTIVRIYDYR